MPLTPFLPMSTYPGHDDDVPPIQNWYYVMVQNGPDEGPFWQWTKNAKNKTRNASIITNSKSTLWEWSLVHEKWYRILWYMPNGDGPYLDTTDYYGSGEILNEPTIHPPEEYKVPWGGIFLGTFTILLVGGLVVWAKKEAEEEEAYGPIVVRG